MSRFLRRGLRSSKKPVELNISDPATSSTTSSPNIKITGAKPQAKQNPATKWALDITEIHQRDLGRPSVTELKYVTDCYLQRPQEVAPEQWSSYIGELISRHPTRRIALLASAHLLLPQDARTLLLGMKDERFLDLVLQLRAANQAIITNEETVCADMLHSTLAESSISQIKQIARIEDAIGMAGLSDELGLETIGLEICQDLCLKLAKHLNQIQKTLNWTTCQLDEEDVSWMASLPENLPVRVLLEKNIPNWTVSQFVRPTGPVLLAYVKG